jgi:hypothetical protein
VNTTARITEDGRISVNITEKTRKLSDLLGPEFTNQLSRITQEEQASHQPSHILPVLKIQSISAPPPPLNIVIQVVGSRGDVQPFVALGINLKSTYGHRVRIATHPIFQNLVEMSGLEFFSIGGDPYELIAFMVRNPGLLPGFESIKNGDVRKHRRTIEDIVLGCWKSCIEAGNGLSTPVRDGGENLTTDINMDADPAERPFVADAIIANPPSFAHIHIAEKLGIPLHMMFT